MPPEPHEFEDLPEALRGDLGRLYRAEVSPSPAVDQAILNRARAHLTGRKRILLLRRVAGAAAAVLIMSAALIPAIRWIDGPDRAVVAHRAVEDVNGDGVVDIRDALALQQRLDVGAAVAGDVTGDGTIDRRDVDAIAMMAVRLERGVAR